MGNLHVQAVAFPADMFKSSHILECQGGASIGNSPHVLHSHIQTLRAESGRSELAISVFQVVSSVKMATQSVLAMIMQENACFLQRTLSVSMP